MNHFRWILALLFLFGSITAIEPVLAQESPESIDLAAMPVAPDQMPETGYLLEGGGFFSSPEQVAQFHGAPGGSGTNESDIAGWLRDNEWQQSYMHRLVLVADADNPGSDLLADEITLLHAFDSEAAASAAVEMFDDFWLGSGDEISGEDAFPTYRFIAESADSLVTVVAVGTVVAEVFSTDLERRPDITDHETVVAATVERMGQSGPGLSDRSVRFDDMKVISFFDSPDSFQHYTVRDGRWISPLVTTGLGVPGGLDSAFQSQQVVTLNNRSQIVVQIWLGAFNSAEDAAALLEKPGFIGNSVPMFASQGTDIDPETIGDLDVYRIHDSSSDGERSTGYRTYLTADDGTTVGIVSLLGSGNIIIKQADLLALAAGQEACLSDSTACTSLSLDDIIVAETDGETPAATPDGAYVDPQFGWSVDYADAGWAFSSVEGETILELQNGRSLASIEAVVDRSGEPTECLLAEVGLLEEFEEHSYITLGSDVEGEAKAGKEPGHAWAVYTVEPLADERADQEYSIRIDCYTLIEGDASLVVHHSAPRDLWESESAKGDDLRANIDISGVAAATSDGTDAQARNVVVLNPRIWIPLAA